MTDRLKAVFVGKEHMTIAHIWEPLALEFKANNWEILFCSDGKTKGDVGFYCEDNSLPGNQNFTIITINGLDQDHVVRPNYSNWFEKENWGLFDLGLLPGQRWFNGWLTRKPSFYNTPTHGVAMVGWFKGDFAAKHFTRSPQNKKVSKVLYAPQTEQDGKQRQVVDSIRNTNLNLTIKHWEDESYIDLFPTLLTPEYMKNLQAENSYAEQFKNITVISPRENIMNVLKEADLLITDQSSVLYEAAMLNVPTLTCSDWKHACGECQGPQPSPDIAISIHSSNLTNYLNEISKHYEDLISNTLLIKEKNFIYLGNATVSLYKQLEELYFTFLERKRLIKKIKKGLSESRKAMRLFKIKRRMLKTYLRSNLGALLR